MPKLPPPDPHESFEPSPTGGMRTPALIVVGIDRDAGRIEAVATRAKKHTTKQLRADFAEAEREAVAAIEQA
jgi:hypothetical protein